MELEKQVCSLQLAYNLAELGLNESSYVWWQNNYPNNPGKYKDEWFLIPSEHYPYTGTKGPLKLEAGWHLLPAYSAAELGAMLPAGYKTTRGHDVFIIEGMPDEPYSIQRAATEADARAKMLIYLLENKLASGEIQ